MDKRDQLLALLDMYQPTAEESQFKKDMIAFIEAHLDCFERSLEIGHITASAWLVDKNNTHALLMHHAKLERWFQLGGHCDGEPDTEAVAIKEAKEESGIQSIERFDSNELRNKNGLVGPFIFDIDIHKIPEYKGIPAHDHYDVRFLLRVTSDEKVIQNSESKELRWISKDSTTLPTKERSVARMFEKWVAKDC